MLHARRQLDYLAIMLACWTPLIGTVLTAEPTRSDALMQDPVGILTILLVVLAAVFCYFIPTTLTTLGILPNECDLYTWIKTSLLPVSLFLLILSLDVPAILRLGWKPVAMLLTGTVSIVVGLG